MLKKSFFFVKKKINFQKNIYNKLVLVTKYCNNPSQLTADSWSLPAKLQNFSKLFVCI